ncbi:hypothetical protein H5410_021664 [Solanum commersonii]|uniref:Uncharacterized protein n=1 Tax=Solanum commersonii TaxID=4109 RepID=A0A9J5ZEL1_SOLCO|nr:hypothetical protein H5410_021664 [Solanum commersonii]
MDGRGSIVPEALEAYPCAVPGKAKGASILTLYPHFLPGLTRPYLFKGASGALKSTVERKILGPSSFSTGFQTFLPQEDEESGENSIALPIEQIQEKNHIENAQNPTPSFIEPV